MVLKYIGGAHSGGDPSTLCVLQVINPLYTPTPDLLIASKAALVEVMGGEAEARDIMCKNPAVLQCGDGLRVLTPDSISSTAAFRQVSVAQSVALR